VLIRDYSDVLTEEMPFLMVMRASQILDVSLTPGDKTSGFLTPIVGIEGGLHLDFDRKKQILFWVEGKDDDEENVRNICNIFLLSADAS
jgi:low density lipoprotein-related protein 2